MWLRIRYRVLGWRGRGRRCRRRRRAAWSVQEIVLGENEISHCVRWTEGQLDQGSRSSRNRLTACWHASFGRRCAFAKQSDLCSGFDLCEDLSKKHTSALELFTVSCSSSSILTVSLELGPILTAFCCSVSIVLAACIELRRPFRCRVVVVGSSSTSTSLAKSFLTFLRRDNLTLAAADAPMALAVFVLSLTISALALRRSLLARRPGRIELMTVSLARTSE